jgi:hypothetical protein
MRALRVGDDALLVEVASGEEAEAVHAELLRRRAEARSPSARSSRPPVRSSSTASPTRPGWPPN